MRPRKQRVERNAMCSKRTDHRRFARLHGRLRLQRLRIERKPIPISFVGPSRLRAVRVRSTAASGPDTRSLDGPEDAAG
jgi:hypothetical protein